VYKTKALFAAAFALVLSVGLSCKSNHPPDVPAVPAGPDYCFKDTTYTFNTVATDPDGDSIALRFDWGDSSVSYWIGWFASGDTVASTHSWSDVGNYEVRVSAQDRERASDLSDRHLVQVAIRWPPETPAAPTGPDIGGQDSSYKFIAGADHPDNIPVAIRFAWGDGDTSDWSEFVPSGGPVSMSHSWSAPDTYAITAQARDTGELTSLWSSPHTIIVRPPDTLLLWRVRLAVGYGRYLSSSPAIAPDGTIYVGSPDSGLYAVSPSGSVKWRYPTGASVRSSPAIAPDGTVYVGSSDSYLYAINPDGTLRWRYLTNGDVRSSPAIAADGTVYFGSNDNCLYALNPDGTLRWSCLTGGSITSSPAVAADGTAYFVSYDNHLYALEPDGALKWRYAFFGDIDCVTAAVDSDGTIYCGALLRGALLHGLSLSLCALNPDGSLRWARSTSGEVRSSPAIAMDGTIYVVSRGSLMGDGVFYALNPDSTLRWRFEPHGSTYSSPAVSSDGTVYFGSWGNFYALRPDATLKWRYETGGGIASSPTIGSDGTVYFTSNDGYLYALKGTSPLADSPWPKFHHDLRNTGQAGASSGGLRMAGAPMLTPDSSGFLINVVNDQPDDVIISWLSFFGTPDAAFMRDFRINADHAGYPIADGLPGTGPGDTVNFTPVTIAPNGSELVELYFADFYVQEVVNPPPGTKANVHGKTFQFRFSDGSVITVNP